MIPAAQNSQSADSSPDELGPSPRPDGQTVTSGDPELNSGPSWMRAMVSWLIFLVITAVVLSLLGWVNFALSAAVALLFAGFARFLLGDSRNTSARTLLAIPISLAAVFGCVMLPSIGTQLTADRATFEVMARDRNRCELLQTGGERVLTDVICSSSASELPDVGDQMEVYVDGWLQQRPERADRFDQNFGGGWLLSIALVGWVGGFGLRAWEVAQGRRETSAFSRGQ